VFLCTQHAKVHGGISITELAKRAYYAIAGPKHEAKAPALLRKFLDGPGGNTLITSITVCRDPINGVIDKFLNFLSLGEFNKAKKDAYFDQLYHLYMQFTTYDGKCYMIEKNQVIQVGPCSEKHSGVAGKVRGKEGSSQCIDVSLRGEKFNLNNMINSLVNLVGAQAAFVYDPLTTNCQHFIYNILKSRGLLKDGDSVGNFILQPAEKLLDKAPVTKSIARFLPDLAARIDILLHGKGFLGGIRYATPS
jgi:ribosomal protein L21E